MNKSFYVALTSLLLACATGVEDERLDTDEDDESCVIADEALEAVGLAVDASGFPSTGDDGGGAPSTRTVQADCTVDSVVASTTSLVLGLTCSDETTIDVPVSVNLSGLPADFEVAIAPATTVRLDHYWQSDGHHISSGQWLVLHDSSGAELLLTAIDHSGVSATSDHLAPLALDIDQSPCKSPCAQDGPDCTEPHRVGVRVTGADEEATVVDGSRQVLESGGQAYDILVARALRWTCLNCSSDYVVVIGARP